jgi:hypothetical protein
MATVAAGGCDVMLLAGTGGVRNRKSVQL